MRKTIQQAVESRNRYKTFEVECIFKARTIVTVRARNEAEARDQVLRGEHLDEDECESELDEILNAKEAE